MRDDDIAGRVELFQDNLQRYFVMFFKDNIQLPLWQPASGLDAATRRHITGLKIPTISSQVPLLLLHNLGRPSHDAQLAERVDGLFHPDSM